MAAVYQAKCKAERRRFGDIMQRDDQKCDMFKEVMPRFRSLCVNVSLYTSVLDRILTLSDFFVIRYR